MSSPASTRRRGHSSRKSQSSTPAKSQQPQTSSPLFFRSSPAVGDQDRTPRASKQAPPGKQCRSPTVIECSIVQIPHLFATAQVLCETFLPAAAALSSINLVGLMDSQLRPGYRRDVETYTPMHSRLLQPSADVYSSEKMACPSESQALKPPSPT
jgi:hypothetical protein